MTTPILNHTRVTAPSAEPEKWLLVLHGIYGSGRNWATIARRLAESRPEWGAVLVDLRLHGASVGFDPPHKLEAAAADVDRLVAELGLHAAAVLGHSFGGKVALLYTAHHGDELRQSWIVESTPAVREPEGSAWRMLEIVRSLPAEFGSRQEAIDALERSDVAAGVAQWMAMNLEPRDGRYRWRLDLDGVEALIRDFFATDLWGVVEEPPEGVELHFVRALSSDTLDAASAARVRAAGVGNGRVHLHEVVGGHWVNAENPDAVIELLVANLP